MLVSILKRHRNMILASIFFFYLGCMTILSFVRIDCVDALAKSAPEKEKNSENIEYAVLILSSPNNEQKRDSIRATWMKLVNNIFIENEEKLYKWNHTQTAQTTPPNFIKFYFVIGTRNLNNNKLGQLHSENDRLKDLLLLDNLEDSYKNLATKMLETFTWFSNNLPNLKYVIKCDDDSFVRVDLVVKDLEAFAPEMTAPEIREYVSFKKSPPSMKGLYWGYFFGRARVYLEGKWQEQDWFLCDKYLPYALGGGYVVSKMIVDYVARNADILSHYHSEDVSMGVWTAALDINRVHDTRFDTEWTSRGCANNMLVRHKQTPTDLFTMYRLLVQSGGTKLCSVESFDRKSYVYNWNVLPSNCCKRQ